MPLRCYGIYLCYAPDVDLRADGLGRQLAAMLLAAEARADVSFVIACPSWMRHTLQGLCDEAGIDFQRLQIIAPAGEPVLLRVRRAVVRLRRRRQGRTPTRLAAWAGIAFAGARVWAEARIAAARSILPAAMLLLVGLPLFALGSIASLLERLWAGLCHGAARRLAPLYESVRARLESLLGNPKADPTILRLYRHMEAAEVRLMHKQIAARPDVAAWFCPTAFWPHFNDIAGPRLMCVPDVVLSEFPIDFAIIGGARFQRTFHDIELAILASHHLVTYSEHVKRSTLVERYHVDPERIAVIPHGVNDLSSLVRVPGLPDDDAAARTYCKEQFRSALDKAVSPDCASIYGSGDVRFFFYASQMRPNKNVLTLLRAYQWLLRKHAIGHKLVLTGHPSGFAGVQEFIAENNIVNDVLFLHRLSASELAACYKLADLAINPSLAEGGFPFTFAEAVSVGTPVIMADIPVTAEFLAGAPFAASMLFDPYDWRALADRIAWALENRNALYAAQRTFFSDVVARRTWSHALTDYINVLESISRPQQLIDERRPMVHA